MLLGLMPTTAFAAGTGKAIQLGTSGISGYDTAKGGTGYDYIYMGSYNSSPVKWRVLDDQTNFDSNGDGTNETGLFLLSEDLLGSGERGDVYFDGTSPYSNAWQGSDAQAWCNTFESSNLDSLELAAILATTKSDDAFTSSTHNVSFAASTNILNSDQVFFLSAEEAVNSEYGFTDDAARIANYGNSASTWWLRSPYADFTSSTGLVDGYGRVYDGGVALGWAARPAFNLNLNSVLFTSAAVGGKPDGGLTTISEYSGNEWKLMLKDSSRSNFAVTSAAVTAYTNGSTVEISYTGAKTGANEYISALLVDDNGNPTYYGRSNAPLTETDGTAQLSVPAGFAEGNYMLKVFNEQYNDNYKTDYASDFTDISLTVKKRVDEQFSLAPGGRYYFDLSGASIPGTANSGTSYGAVSLPDTSLHYVPFTYAGTIEAYKLTSAMATTEEYAQQNKYAHSLFVADYAVTHTISWGGLNDEGLIFGKNYASGGVDYTLRAPSVGSNSTGSGDSQRGVPQSNEWDTMLNKNSGYIKNWNGIYSWGQDTTRYNSSLRAVRGYDSGRRWNDDDATDSLPLVGFRPVLEVLNPDTLSSDGLKVVTLDLGGGTLGGSSEDIQIIVKNGSEFTAPASDGLNRPDGNTGSYFMWLGSNGKLYAPGASVPADVTKLTAQFALSEQFFLTPGGTYYFDLSAMNIPGTANSGNSYGAASLPDTSLHYVPFTYAGTIEAYKLTSAMVTTEEYAQQNKYAHSLFVADYAVTHTISWGGLNDEGLIFGKNYASGGVDYTLRAPSVGSNYTGSGNSERGTPQSNEWDAVLDKNSGYIQNWNKMYLWGQDTVSGDASSRARRGYSSTRYWYSNSATLSNPSLGFRPVLEVLNPDTLGSDGLKVVTLDLNGGKLGGSSDAIQIIVKNGSTFTAPMSGGLTRPDGDTGSYFMWLGSDGKLYAPGASVPADVTKLTAQWRDIAVPTGEIKIAENGWKSFFNTITFDLFFKDTQMVTVTAADNSGEAVTVEYLLSEKALTESELARMTFTAYSAPFSINADNEYVIYAKLTDTSGNVAYINTNGIVLDATVPVISGIEAGKTYCAAQTVTVTEKYISTVKVNGTEVSLDKNSQFALSPASGEQTIVVTDKAGNETRVTVTVNDGHTYEWQSENGQYWQKCKFCNHETAKKDIPTINISGADKVCRTQDYKFSFTLPEGATDAACGYEFIGLGGAPLTPTVENGLYSGIIKASTYPAKENIFKLIVSVKTADGFAFSAEKKVTIQNEHTGGTATCKDKAKCGGCGESYGKLDPNNHANLKHIDAKAATKTSEGNIEYWYCDGCNKYYKDAKATQEITKAQTVTAKLPDDSKSSQTGDNSNLALWIALLFISGGAVTVTTVYGRKKKRLTK